MTHCKKCNGSNITGPNYGKSALSGEYLRYRCCNCGYHEDHPTADAVENGGYIPVALRHAQSA